MFWRRPEIYRARSLERLSSPDDLEEVIQIVRPMDWIPVAVLGAALLLALVWSIAGRVPTMLSARSVVVPASAAGAPPVTVAYVPVSQARRIRVGMPARILIAPGDGQPAGVIPGTVASVSTAIVSGDEPARDGIRAPRQGCPCVEIVTSIDGDVPEAVVGAMTTTSITVDRRRPITYLLPFLRAAEAN
jgi:hypothetical protein